jgi:hypothetical protein
MGKVLVESSKVTCGAAPPHQGELSMQGVARLVVAGRPVLTVDSVKDAALSVAAPCQNPGNAGGPCTRVGSPSEGASTRLRVDGVSVVLDSLQAQTDKQSPVHVDPLATDNDLLRADK